jgi:F-type H+-transporting ATPase subunit b
MKSSLRRSATLAAIFLMAAGSAHADTMPQLDFKNPLVLSQVVWGALIFAGFYGLASRWGLPKVGAILEMRANTIAADLDQARDAMAQADAAVAELNAARKKAYAQSQAEIADATAKAKAEAAARAAEQDARLDAKLAESEAQIHRARAAALGALREVATETAQAVVARLTDGHADYHRIDAAVGDLLAERGLAA